MERASSFRPSSRAAVAFERNLQGHSGGVRGRSRGSLGRSRGPVDETKPDGHSRCGAAGVEEVPFRTFLHQQEAPAQRVGSPTRRVVLRAGSARGGPTARLEIESDRFGGESRRPHRSCSRGGGSGLWREPGRAGSLPSPSCHQDGRGSTRAHEKVEREGSGQVHDQGEQVGLERIILRPCISSTAHWLETQERTEQRQQQHEQQHESGLGSRGSVSGGGPSTAHFKEVSRTADEIRHQGGSQKAHDSNRGVWGRSQSKPDFPKILSPSVRSLGGQYSYETGVLDPGMLSRCYLRGRCFEMLGHRSSAHESRRTDRPRCVSRHSQSVGNHSTGVFYAGYHGREQECSGGTETGGQSESLFEPERQRKMGEFVGEASVGGSFIKGGQRLEGRKRQGGEGKTSREITSSEGDASSSERSSSSEGVNTVVSISDASPPRLREGFERDALPCDLFGKLSQLGPLLCKWLRLNHRFGPNADVSDPCKRHSTAEVFPLPMLPGGLPPEEQCWLEAATRALNWLAVGDLAISERPATPTQKSLLQELHCSFGALAKLGSQSFDGSSIDSYWRSKSVNGYGEEVHCAMPFSWANVQHSLPTRELAGALDGVKVASGGVKDFLERPLAYLKPEGSRTWMKPPRVMVRPEDWGAVAEGLLERRICDVIPLDQVIHVSGKPVLGGLFGVPKNEEVDGIPVLRLIMDLRPINKLFESIVGDLNTLPMLGQLLPLEIFPEETVLVSSEDIKAMFYIVGLPDCWRPLLAFGREIPDHLRPEGMSGPCVLTSRVLPMGFINSVSVAQALHRNIVNHAVDDLGISREAEVRRDQVLPLSSILYRVYLDNFDLLERSNREAARLLSGDLSAPASKLRNLYHSLNIPVNEKKSVKSSLVAEMQGGLVDGVAGTISPKHDKVARYLRGAWHLLQSKRASLKRIHMVAGGLVYLFSYRRCLMSCLNEVWHFISSFEGNTNLWKPIPDRVHTELFCCVALAPLSYMDIRAPYDSVVTASDASETGGGLSFSSGLTHFGLQASGKSVRGDAGWGLDDFQVLVISLCDGIGACRVALDVLGAKVGGYVAVEADPAARRVVESSFGSTEFVSIVEDISEQMVKGWACKYSRSHLVLIIARHCHGTCGNHSSTDREVSRIRALVRANFPWAEIFMLVESASSLSDAERCGVTRAIGVLPYEIDSVGITPCRRSRFFWFDRVVQTEDAVKIERPLTAHADDFGRISFLLPCLPEPYLMPGWELAGGAGQKLPAFTISDPKARPDSKATGLESCSVRDLEYWRADRCRFPPYQYRFQHGLIHPKHGWRIPNINEREAMMGLPLDYTHHCWAKAHRKQDPVGWEDCRMSLIGVSGSVPVLAFLLRHLLCPRGLCSNMTAAQIQHQCQAGTKLQLNEFLVRPPWSEQNRRLAAGNDANFVRKLGSLMSTKGSDVLLQSSTEPVKSYDRLPQYLQTSGGGKRRAAGGGNDRSSGIVNI